MSEKGKDQLLFCLLNRGLNLRNNVPFAWTPGRLYSGHFCDNGMTPALVWVAQLHGHNPITEYTCGANGKLQPS